MTWISVEDALPSDGQAVLVCRKGNNWLSDHILADGTPEQVWRWQAAKFMKPAHTIRNTNPAAKGSSYFVYHVKDVNKVFALFASQAEMVSVGRYKHPFIEGKFKLSK